MSKPATIDDAMKIISDLQSRLDQSENARVWAQSTAFEFIARDMKNPTEMVLKAQFVGQKQAMEKQNKMIERLLAENKDLVGKIGTYKDLERTLNRLQTNKPLV